MRCFFGHIHIEVYCQSVLETLFCIYMSPDGSTGSPSQFTSGENGTLCSDRAKNCNGDAARVDHHRLAKKKWEVVALLSAPIFFDTLFTVWIGNISSDSHGSPFFILCILCTHSSSVTLSHPSSTHPWGWADVVHGCTSHAGVHQSHLIEAPIHPQENWEKFF